MGLTRIGIGDFGTIEEAFHGRHVPGVADGAGTPAVDGGAAVADLGVGAVGVATEETGVPEEVGLAGAGGGVGGGGGILGKGDY